MDLLEKGAVYFWANMFFINIFNGISKLLWYAMLSFTFICRLQIPLNLTKNKFDIKIAMFYEIM